MEKSITTQKMKFSLKDFFSKCEQIRKKKTANLFISAKEILNGKIHFLCSVCEVLTPSRHLLAQS